MGVPESSAANPAPLSFLLNLVGRRVEEAMESSAGTPTLSVAQAKFLWHMLAKPAGITLAELAERAGCTRANVTQILDRLQAARLIERRANPDDGRSTVAVVTPEGSRAFRRVEREVMAFERRLTAGLGPSNAEQLQRCLRRALQLL